MPPHPACGDIATHMSGLQYIGPMAVCLLTKHLSLVCTEASEKEAYVIRWNYLTASCDNWHFVRNKNVTVEIMDMTLVRVLLWEIMGCLCHLILIREKIDVNHLGLNKITATLQANIQVESLDIYEYISIKFSQKCIPDNWQKSALVQVIICMCMYVLNINGLN